MSNKRRKTIGSTKIKRNLLVRIARGARKSGTPWPGYGRAYSPHLLESGWELSPALDLRGQKLRDEMRTLVMPHWKGWAD